ncbi:hypothetical protein Tco_1241303 [Tanacetum coccineum]
MDESTNNGRGPYVFKILEHIHHWIGSGSRGPELELVRESIGFLDMHNELVQLFCTTRDKCDGQDMPEFRLRLYNVVGAREYDFPSSQTLGGIVFDSRRGP